MSRLSCLSVLLAVACGGGNGGGDPDADVVAFDRRAMLAHLADHLFVPTYEQFEADAAALATALEAHCAALDTGADDPSAARTAWATAMDTWELADAVQVGPSAADDGRVRNRIYGWPLLAPCTLDQDVMVRWTTPAAYDVETRLDNARSLAAIEYLLFYTDVVSSCPVPPTGWDALGADRPRARCRLAAAVAADVAAQAAALATAWRPTGGNYRDQLALAGTAGSSIAGEREAVNMVSDGMFYVDTMVKDMKLGEAAGITINACGTIEEPCLREVEHRFADHSTPALRVNLRALRAAFTGTTAGADGPGFDDYLTAVGAPEVAARMTASIDAAIALADDLPASFLTTLTTDRARVVALHAATKAITDDMKSQFLTVLGLDIPDDVAGDND
ncbi:MAG: imelysin family protein [Kofleriaceae bacterium]|nr:imelysin family protein [Kofleriaceae bacterium]MCL4224503.1 imelysin family protein [Myxococcales bacterium]